MVVSVVTGAGAAGVTTVVVVGSGARFTETHPERTSNAAGKSREKRMD